MADSADVVSVLVALEFVVMSLVLLLLGPIDKVFSIIPLFVVFLIALLLSRM